MCDSAQIMKSDPPPKPKEYRFGVEQQSMAYGSLGLRAYLVGGMECGLVRVKMKVLGCDFHLFSLSHVSGAKPPNRYPSDDMIATVAWLLSQCSWKSSAENPSLYCLVSPAVYFPRFWFSKFSAVLAFKIFRAFGCRKFPCSISKIPALWLSEFRARTARCLRVKKVSLLFYFTFYAILVLQPYSNALASSIPNLVSRNEQGNPKKTVRLHVTPKKKRGGYLEAL